MTTRVPTPRGANGAAAAIDAAVADAGHLRDQIDLARRKLWEASSDDEMRLWCQWGMEQLSQAARRLESTQSRDELRHRYANWDCTLRRVRSLERTPTTSLGAALLLLKQFGGFLVRQNEAASHRGWIPRDCAPDAIPRQRKQKNL